MPRPEVVVHVQLGSGHECELPRARHYLANAENCVSLSAGYYDSEG